MTLDNADLTGVCDLPTDWRNASLDGTVIRQTDLDAATNYRARRWRCVLASLMSTASSLPVIMNGEGVMKWVLVIVAVFLVGFCSAHPRISSLNKQLP